MKKIATILFIIEVFLFYVSCSHIQQNKQHKKLIQEKRKTELAENKIIEHGRDDFLLLKTFEESCKYVDKTGKIIIPQDKYIMCFTDTFRNYAIVLDEEKGFIGINRNQDFLYSVFVFDNGPDFVSDGLFRIVKDGKIGYADAKTGKILIKPKFQAAYPFENGKAKVAEIAEKIQEGEHFYWESDKWIEIDKNGKEITN